MCKTFENYFLWDRKESIQNMFYLLKSFSEMQKCTLFPVVKSRMIKRPKIEISKKKEKPDLFSHNYDRENIVRSMLGIDAAGSVEACISVRSFLKVVLHLWRDVLIVHPDELVAVVPHWC